MTGILAELAGSLAGRVLASLTKTPRTEPESFANALLAAQRAGAPAAGRLLPRVSAATLARGRARIAGLARKLAGLPVTRENANGLAVKLWALVEDIKRTIGGGNRALLAENALADFVSRASAKFMLCEADRLRLAEVAGEYLEEELPGAARLHGTDT